MSLCFAGLLNLVANKLIKLMITQIGDIEHSQGLNLKFSAKLV